MNHKFGFSFWASVGILFIFLAISIVSCFWTPHDPMKVAISNVLMEPSSEYLLGTDSLGRDILSRLMLGSRISISFGILAAFLTMTLGLILGVASGYFGGWVDYGIQSVVYLFQGIPGYAFMIAITGILEPSMFSLTLAVVITSWTSFAQMIRGEVLAVKSKPYVKSVIVLGATPFYCIRHYIMPTVIPLALTLLMMRISTTILLVASLSFIGLGIQPPLADWGIMVQEGMTYYRTFPRLVYIPGIAIILFCGCLNYIGERLRGYYL